jgi:RsiW-degrading membrane proteinase PrsW (M82 family)
VIGQPAGPTAAMHPTAPSPGSFTSIPSLPLAPPAPSAGVPDPPPRWGLQVSFIQPREPAFWLYMLLFVVGGYLFVIEQAMMSALLAAYALSWLLVLVYAVPVALIIYRLDLFEREPKLMLAAALLWGGVVATSLAAQANDAWLSLLGKVVPPDLAVAWGPAVVGPGVEETLKLMGVVLLYLVASQEFDGPMDGFVYGAMVGLGFTVVEDVSYFIGHAAAVSGTVDQIGPVFDTFLIRVVAGGLYGHVLFTGLTGTGFAYLVTRRRASPIKRIGAMACIGAGIAAHFVWNSPWMDSILDTVDGVNPSTLQWVEYGSVKGLPFLLLLVVLVFFATRNEEADFRAIVTSEPDPAVITEPEIKSLRSLLARRSARLAMGRLRGPDGARLLGQLQSTQIDYALARSRVDGIWDPALEAPRRKIRAIRAQLAALPLVGAMPGPAAPAGSPAGSPAGAPRAGWYPTHTVPPGGMGAWSHPDPTRPPALLLPERLELAVESWTGVWALVRASNGWIGWVDGRFLVPCA